MLNSGLLMNKSSYSFKDILFGCLSCELGKSRTLPFPMYDDIVIGYSDLIHVIDCSDLIHIDI